jgi:prefoldin subunit 5
MNDKPTVDERLEALAQSLELLTHDIHEMQATMVRLDSAERRARRALLNGIEAYLRALDDSPEAA